MPKPRPRTKMARVRSTSGVIAGAGPSPLIKPRSIIVPACAQFSTPRVIESFGESEQAFVALRGYWPDDS